MEPYDRLKMYKKDSPEANFKYIYVSELLIHSKGIEQVIRAYLANKYKLRAYKGREWYKLTDNLNLQVIINDINRLLSNVDLLCGNTPVDYRIELEHYNKD